MLVLLPALAWLQDSWLDQIADADRERRARTLQTAASQLAQDFDARARQSRSSRCSSSRAIVEQRDVVRVRREVSGCGPTARWHPRSSRPSISSKPADRRHAQHDAAAASLEPATHTFDATPWPASSTAIRARFLMTSERSSLRRSTAARESGRTRGGGRGGQRMLFPPHADRRRPVDRRAGHARDAAPWRMAMPPRTPDVKLLGFTIIRFDLDGARQATSCRCWSRDISMTTKGDGDFLVAVVARDDPSQVIFESEPGAAAIADVRAGRRRAHCSGRGSGQFLFMARDGDAATRDSHSTCATARPPPPPPSTQRRPSTSSRPSAAMATAAVQRRPAFRRRRALAVDRQASRRLARGGGGRGAHAQLRC